MSPPWETNNKNTYRHRAVELDSTESKTFINERTRLHELYITEQEKTKRISLILAVVLILASVFFSWQLPREKKHYHMLFVGYYSSLPLVLSVTNVSGEKYLLLNLKLTKGILISKTLNNE
ncbi:hypothetical protein BWI92_23755 [Flectobacillus sp. BAB-3569]|nr:hypothetical protein BWI92_23755 [Flectobacillus sp. BAB-3569]